MMNIMKPCDLNKHVCWLLKSWALAFILNTYAGMPLNSSEVINGISLIFLCSLEGFFVTPGSSTLTGSSESRSDTLTLQNRDAQHTGNRQNCMHTRKKSASNTWCRWQNFKNKQIGNKIKPERKNQGWRGILTSLSPSTTTSLNVVGARC